MTDARQRAVATANELLKKLSECIELADLVASTVWFDGDTVRKYADVSRAIYEVAKEVDGYDICKR